MNNEDKQAIRCYFATKGAWHRHIARVLEHERKNVTLMPPEAQGESWIDLALHAEKNADFIRTSFGERVPTVMDGIDFIRDAYIIFDLKNRRGKRLYRRYMRRQAVEQPAQDE